MDISLKTHLKHGEYMEMDIEVDIDIEIKKINSYLNIYI